MNADEFLSSENIHPIATSMQAPVSGKDTGVISSVNMFLNNFMKIHK